VADASEQLSSATVACHASGVSHIMLRGWVVYFLTAIGDGLPADPPTN